MQYDATDILDDVSSDEAILIEYLDGELAFRDRQIVEQRLAEEPELRELLSKLEKSWQYLDLLDIEKTDQDLVEASLETVVLDAEKNLDKLQKQSRFRIPWKFLALTLSAFLVFAISYHVGWLQAGDKNFFVRIAAPIIERLDMYLMLLDEDPELELLRLLTERRVFLPPTEHQIDPDQYSPDSQAVVPEHYSLRPSMAEIQRRLRRIESLDETLYDQFYWRNQRFKRMDWEEKMRIKSLHEEIARSPRYFELFQTLQSYYTWFKSLQAYEKAELRKKSLPVVERADLIETLKKRLENNRESFYVSPNPLISRNDPSNIKKLVENLEALSPMQRDNLLEDSPEQILGKLNGSAAWQ